MSKDYTHLANMFEASVKQMYPDIPDAKAVDIAWDAAIDVDEAAQKFWAAMWKIQREAKERRTTPACEPVKSPPGLGNPSNSAHETMEASLTIDQIAREAGFRKADEVMASNVEPSEPTPPLTLDNLNIVPSHIMPEGWLGVRTEGGVMMRTDKGKTFFLELSTYA